MLVKASLAGVAAAALVMAAVFIQSPPPRTANASVTKESNRHHAAPAPEKDADEAGALKLTAVSGSLSDFWSGRALQLGDSFWVVQRGESAGASFVIAYDDSLIGFHADGRSPTIARVDMGRAAKFMAMLEGEGCGCCPSECEQPYSTWQACCNELCEEGTQAYCYCSAGATCQNSGGVKSVTFIAESGTCSFECRGESSG